MNLLDPQKMELARARWSGEEAAQDNRPITSCPYTPGTKLWDTWMSHFCRIE